MNEEELRFLANEDYAWLCDQMKDPANDVTKDHPDWQDKFMYTHMCAAGHKSKFAMIDDSFRFEKSGSCIPVYYDATVIEAIHIDENETTRMNRPRDEKVSAVYATGLIRDVAGIVLGYAREPIDIITFTFQGGHELSSFNVYEYPFTDMPKDPITSEMANFCLSFKCASGATVERVDVKGGVIVYDNPKKFGSPYWMPGYNIVMKDYWPTRGANWKVARMKYAWSGNGYTV